jgi:hypothetical protein
MRMTSLAASGNDGIADALDFTELRDRLGEIQRDMLAFPRPEAGSRFRSPSATLLASMCAIRPPWMACQLHSYADYLLAGDRYPIGWPYDRILTESEPQREPRPRVSLARRSSAPTPLPLLRTYQAKDDAVSLTLVDLTRRQSWQRMVGTAPAIAIGDPVGLSQISDLF